jgi:hypothetical protein
MMHANSAKVDWDLSKKQWHVQIHVGGEVIKRHFPNQTQSAADDDLRSEAVTTAKDEGYELDPAQVEIAH